MGGLGGRTAGRTVAVGGEGSGVAGLEVGPQEVVTAAAVSPTSRGKWQAT